MKSANFALDRSLSVSLLEMHSGAGVINEDRLDSFALQSGSRMLEIINEVARLEKGVSTQLTGSQIPIARIEGNACRWLDPRLAHLIASRFEMDPQRHSSFICALIVQFASFISQNTEKHSGALGDVIYSPGNGVLALVIRK